jgi:hypothetical protein
MGMRDWIADGSRILPCADRPCFSNHSAARHRELHLAATGKFSWIRSDRIPRGTFGQIPSLPHGSPFATAVSVRADWPCCCSVLTSAFRSGSYGNHVPHSNFRSGHGLATLRNQLLHARSAHLPSTLANIATSHRRPGNWPARNPSLLSYLPALAWPDGYT